MVACGLIHGVRQDTGSSPTKHREKRNPTAVRMVRKTLHTGFGMGSGSCHFQASRTANSRRKHFFEQFVKSVPLESGVPCIPVGGILACVLWELLF